MACDQYSSGINAEVTLTEHNLPGSFCPATWQDVLHQFILSTTANLPGAYSTFIISSSAPAPDDQDKLWLQVDSVTCKPIGFYLFFNGAWVRVDGAIFYGEDVSTTANNYLINTLNPTTNFINAGSQLLVVKAIAANTGPATITVNAFNPAVVGTALVKYGSQPLSELDILPGMLMLIAWDGINFQLLNPRPSGNVDTTVVNDLENGSFELDSDSNGLPDYWDWNDDVNSLGLGFAKPSGIIAQATASTRHGARSFAITQVADNIAITKCVGRLISRNYIGCDENEIINVSWWMKVEAGKASGTAASPIAVAAVFYDRTKVELSRKLFYYNDCYSGDTTYPTAWAHFGGIAQAPADARFFRMEFIVGGTAADPYTVSYVAQATTNRIIWIDDVRVRDDRQYNNIVFLTDSHFYIPTGIYAVKVTLVGGGGAGWQGSIANRYGGGGGGGETTVRWLCGDWLYPTTALFLTVGLGSLPVGVGTQSVVSSLNLATRASVPLPIGNIVADFGDTANNIPGAAGGDSGGASNGDYHIPGLNGGDGIFNVGGGSGGSSQFGGGGRPGGLGATTGGDGTISGGGGGGSRNGSVAGSGAQGSIMIEYFKY